MRFTKQMEIDRLKRELARVESQRDQAYADLRMARIQIDGLQGIPTLEELRKQAEPEPIDRETKLMSAILNQRRLACFASGTVGITPQSRINITAGAIPTHVL